MGPQEPESRLAPRDRLARIGHHFLSDDARELHLGVLARTDDYVPLRTPDLARVFARLGRTVALLEPEQATMLHIRALPAASAHAIRHTATEPFNEFERSEEEFESPRRTEIMIVETASPERLAHMPFALLAVPADEAGMRRAWLDLKSLSSRRTRPGIGVTITGAADLYEAEYCFERFAGAAERFLGLEVESYACLLQCDRDREQQLRNIAALLLAAPRNGIPIRPETTPEEHT